MLIKILLLDINFVMHGIYKVIAYIGIGVALIIVSMIYQKYSSSFNVELDLDDNKDKEE